VTGVQTCALPISGFEPVNLGSKGQHATSRPPKLLYQAGYYFFFIFPQLKWFGNSFELSDYNCFVNMLLWCHNQCILYLLLAEIQGALCAYKYIRLMSVLLCKLKREDSPVWIKNISSLSSTKHTFRVSHDENNFTICNYVLWHLMVCYNTSDCRVT
jgi:hypothetical protein